MDGDDDRRISSSPPSPPLLHEEPSLSIERRKLKRLKKSCFSRASNPISSPSDDRPSMLPADSFGGRAFESSDDGEFKESDGGMRIDSNSDPSIHDNDHSEAKRDTVHDPVVGEFDGREGITVFRTDISEKDMLKTEVSVEKKKSKKRVKADGSDDRPKPSNKRREEKERKAYLQQLHADSQRLLRETGDAAFKPIPVVHRPISSVLEKIRKRKLDVSKKVTILNDDGSSIEKSSPSRVITKDPESEGLMNVGRHDSSAKEENEDIIACQVVASQIDGPTGSTSQSTNESTPTKAVQDEKSMHAFRAPLDDTQDLNCDSQASDTIEELPNDQPNSKLEEVLAPSLLKMNLKLDSAPPEHISDDEDNEKENSGLRREEVVNLPSSPNGDPVKAFVDDEAEEEDDGDNDLRFQESEEEEDTGDVEEFVDLIATENEEKATDTERRHQLHQQWLEQQDAAGTETLLQRLNYGSKQKESTLLIDGDEEDLEEDFGGEEEDNVAVDVAKINTRKIKQMIPEMFDEKEDAFLSSDDEETEKRLVKQLVLDKAEEQVTFLSPAEDESSREVFGLIKKLNTVPDTRKKARTSSLFDTMLTGGNSNSNSKSSFLCRVSSQSLPSSHKRASSSTGRSFIFGRDDSNSRSSTAVSEDLSEQTPVESRPSRNPSAKFVGSQSKSTHQITDKEAGTGSSSSLFEILRRSTTRSNHRAGNGVAGVSETVFSSFKCTTKSIKVERNGRT